MIFNQLNLILLRCRRVASLSRSSRGGRQFCHPRPRRSSETRRTSASDTHIDRRESEAGGRVSSREEKILFPMHDIFEVWKMLFHQKRAELWMQISKYRCVCALILLAFVFQLWPPRPWRLLWFLLWSYGLKIDSGRKAYFKGATHWNKYLKMDANPRMEQNPKMNLNTINGSKSNKE